MPNALQYRHYSQHPVVWILALVLVYGALPWLANQLVLQGTWPVALPLITMVMLVNSTGLLILAAVWQPYKRWLFGAEKSPLNLVAWLGPAALLWLGMVVIGLIWAGVVWLSTGQFPLADAPITLPTAALGWWLNWVILSPLVEECLFRGWGQGACMALGKKVLPIPANTNTVAFGILVPALLFGGLHSQYWQTPWALVTTLLLGIWLGWGRYRYDSIVPGLLAHMAYNALGLALLTL